MLEAATRMVTTTTVRGNLLGTMSLESVKVKPPLIGCIRRGSGDWIGLRGHDDFAHDWVHGGGVAHIYIYIYVFIFYFFIHIHRYITMYVYIYIPYMIVIQIHICTVLFLCVSSKQ